MITLLTFPRFQELDDMKLFIDKVMPALAWRWVGAPSRPDVPDACA